MGQVKNLALGNLADFPSLAVPDASDPARYAHWPALLARAEVEGKYVIVCNGSYIFERAHFLHGFENTRMASFLEPELMRSFLRHLAQYLLDTIAYIKRHFAGRIHGYRGTDDWGTQSAPLVSPATFDGVFAPVYRELFAAIHVVGMDAWMHSCGRITPLLDAMIASGLDVVNIVQPNVLPIVALAPFRGRICFEVCADAQTTLPRRCPEALAAEIQAILDNCCAADGGVVEVKLDRMYFDGDSVPPENGEICHREYQERDPFRRLTAPT